MNASPSPSESDELMSLSVLRLFFSFFAAPAFVALAFFASAPGLRSFHPAIAVAHSAFASSHWSFQGFFSALVISFHCAASCFVESATPSQRPLLRSAAIQRMYAVAGCLGLGSSIASLTICGTCCASFAAALCLESVEGLLSLTALRSVEAVPADHGVKVIVIEG